MAVIATQMLGVNWPQQERHLELEWMCSKYMLSDILNQFLLQRQKFEFEYEDRHVEFPELFVSQPFTGCVSSSRSSHCTGKMIE